MNFCSGQTIGSICTIYTGTDLQFLQYLNPVPILKCNASLDDVVEDIDLALTNLLSGNNLKNLNVRCLTFDPSTITPAGLHQVEIDKICALDASLTTLTETVSNLNIANMQIAINLQCLSAAAAPCISPSNTYPLIAVLNAMVSEICALKAAVGI